MQGGAQRSYPGSFLGNIMKPAVITLTPSLERTLLGFLAIAFGYITYADSSNYFDREGSTGMVSPPIACLQYFGGF